MSGSGSESKKERNRLNNFSEGVLDEEDNRDGAVSTLAKVMVRVGVRGLRIVFMPLPLVWARLPVK